MTVQYDEGSGIPNERGDIFWYVNGKLHRLEGPARIWQDGTKKRWYQNGIPHRIDGPAVEYANNDKRYKWWYLNGKFIAFRIENPIIRKMIKISNGEDFNNIAIVLRHIEGVFWEILLGNKKEIAYCVGD